MKKENIISFKKGLAYAVLITVSIIIFVILNILVNKVGVFNFSLEIIEATNHVEWGFIEGFFGMIGVLLIGSILNPQITLPIILLFYGFKKIDQVI